VKPCVVLLEISALGHDVSHQNPHRPEKTPEQAITPQLRNPSPYEAFLLGSECRKLSYCPQNQLPTLRLIARTLV
jgi:hypothetical protein